MKILLVHNFYGSTAPSGENTAFSAELDLLRERGHEVAGFTRNSDEVLQAGFYGKVRGALATVWNPLSLIRLKEALKRSKPDIVHVHNTFPLLSPSVLYAMKDFDLPTVMTLHNYRIGCSAGTALRGNESCTLCLDRHSVLPALRYGCYRESRIATLPVALMIAFHNARESWKKNIDAFITLTDFHKEKMVAFGLPEPSLFVKPHFLERPPHPIPWDMREAKALFIGRLYAAKGIHVLIEAWTKWGKEAPRLEVIGDGPMREELVRAAENSDAAQSVSFLGNISHEETMRRLSTARLLIVPSMCFEGFPMVVPEAYASGVPIATSDIGSLSQLVAEGRTGLLFPPGDVDGLLERVRPVIRDEPLLRMWGEGARAEFDAKYTAEPNYHQLMRIYAAAAAHRGISFN